MVLEEAAPPNDLQRSPTTYSANVLLSSSRVNRRYPSPVRYSTAGESLDSSRDSKILAGLFDWRVVVAPPSLQAHSPRRRSFGDESPAARDAQAIALTDFSPLVETRLVSE